MLGNRLARSLEGVGVALLIARPLAAQARACSPLASDSMSAQSAARWTAPLDRPVTVRATALSLRDALDRVAAIAKLRLSYSSEVLPLDRAVCLSANAEPVGKVLAGLMAGTNVAAVSAGGDQVALTPRAAPAQSAPAPEMARSLGVLDRVVVTGSAMGAPERELTVGLNVLSGRQLSRENTGTLSGALDSYVPGVWSWAQSPTSMLSSYASIRGASSFGLSYPKIYIDGIEVANPLLVSRFAPDAIDRIEVIRGPQGSALYGTDAISGVVNIVTRHEGLGAEGERGAVRTTAGVTQSAFSHNALSQEHARLARCRIEHELRGSARQRRHDRRVHPECVQPRSARQRQRASRRRAEHGQRHGAVLRSGSGQCAESSHHAADAPRRIHASELVAEYVAAIG